MYFLKKDPTICFLQKTHFTCKDTHRINVKGLKKVFHANGDQKTAAVTILILGNIGFKKNCKK
jgi:hypothetical protein